MKRTIAYLLCHFVWDNPSEDKRQFPTCINIYAIIHQNKKDNSVLIVSIYVEMMHQNEMDNSMQVIISMCMG